MKHIIKKITIKRCLSGILAMTILCSILADKLAIPVQADSGVYYTISYASKGSPAGMPPKSTGHVEGEIIQVASNSNADTIKRTGYQFAGWKLSTASDADEVEYECGDDYIVSDSDADENRQITFHAVWDVLPVFQVKLWEDGKKYKGRATENDVTFEFISKAAEEIEEEVQYYYYATASNATASNADAPEWKPEDLDDADWCTVEDGDSAQIGNLTYYFKADSMQHKEVEYINPKGYKVNRVKLDYTDIIMKAVNDQGEYFSNDWSSGPVTITLDGGLSGESRESYQFQETDITEENPDGEDWSDLPGEELTVSEEGKKRYWFRVKSKFGKYSENVYFDVRIDKVSPELTVTFTDDIAVSNVISYRGSVGESGVKSFVICHVDKTEHELDALEGDYPVTQNGDYLLKLTNGAGVTISKEVRITNTDTAHPQITVDLDVSGKTYQAGSWTDNTVRATLNNRNVQQKGTTRFYYKSGAEGTWELCDNSTDYQAVMKIGESGDAQLNRTYYFKAAAQNGLESEIREYTVKIDKKKPEAELRYQNTIAQSQDIRYIINTGISGIREIAIVKNVDGKQEREILLSSSDDTVREVDQVYPEVSKNGVYTFEIVNGVGTKITRVAILTNIDRKDPVITMDSGGYREGVWIGSEVVFTLGNRAGNLGETEYWVQENPDAQWISIGKSRIGIQYRINKSADDVYRFKAVSQAGRSSISRGFHVKVDTGVPRIRAEGDTATYAREQTIKIHPASGISGIAKVEVRKDGGAYANITKSYESGYTIKENGSYQFRLTNGLANPVVVESNVLTFANIDREKPTMSLSRHGYNSGKWTTKDVRITLKNTNKKNLGDSRYFYRLSGGHSDSWTEFGGEIVFDEDTDAVYDFMVKSAAGTESSEDSVNIRLDNKEPEELKIAFGDEELRELKSTDKINKIYKDPVKVTFYAEDSTSGVRYFTYSLKDGNSTKIEKVYAKSDGNGYSAEVLIEPQYLGDISIAAYDGVELHYPKDGRKVDMTFVVDSKMPTAPVIDSHGYVADTWTNDNIQLTVSGSEALSGVKRYEYTVTDGVSPAADAIWTAMEPTAKLEPAGKQPEHVVSSEINFSSDTNIVYYFRAVSQSDVAGEVAGIPVKLQKTLPPNALVSYPVLAEDEWYKSPPQILLTPPEPTPAPVGVFYKLWNTTVGESVEAAEEIKYDGTNAPRLENDGEYILKVWTVDQAGNRSDTEHDFSAELRLDGTLPQVKVLFDQAVPQNDNYYNQDRKASVVIDELNFDPSKVTVSVEHLSGEGSKAVQTGEWSSNGNTHTAVLSFTAEAVYRVNIDCTDKAGNRAVNPQVYEFTIDKTEPEVEIGNVTNLAPSRDAVTPVITFSDTNMDLSRSRFMLEGNQNGSVSLHGKPQLKNGSYVYELAPVDIDDNYVLTAEVYDKAGNKSVKAVSFSVNQHGATFVFEQKDIVGGYTNQPFRPSIQIWDVDEVTVVSMTVNGKEAPYTLKDGVLTLKDEIHKDGKYVLALDVTDAAGNASSMNMVQFYYDATKPINHILGVTEGEYYFEPVTVTVKQDSPSDQIKEIRLNGKTLSTNEYTSSSDHTVQFTVSEYDNYTLEVIAVDEAGNISETAPVRFTLSDNFFTKVVYKGKRTVKSLLNSIFR